MNTSTQKDPAYVMGRSAEETERLQNQALLLNPSTRRLLEEAGITTAMKILDIGSGAGDVTMLAADLVGPTGTVVAVDTNPAVLATARERARAAGLANVTFLEGDLWTVGLDGSFDGLVGRFVLMYLQDPAAALRRLAGHVRPGGVIAFQELDFTLRSIEMPPGSLQPKLLQMVHEVFRRAGAEPQMGLKLYRAFLDAGLPGPQMRLEAPLGGGPGCPVCRLWADALRSALPLLEKFGITTAAELDLDTLAERLGDEEIVMHPAIVGAWTRKV